MSLENEVSELKGRLSVLEKFVLGSLVDQLLDAKLKAINAEATAVRAAEVVQATISELSSPGVSGEESASGFMDIRNGFTGVSKRKEEVDES